jgi:hypothetical protein
MPDSSHRYPRAYVAAPVAPANGLFQAINWAFEQSEDLTWASIGILVPEPGLGQDFGHLHRLKARGVKIGTVDQALRAQMFHGVLIAYAPDRHMLIIAEDVPGLSGLAAVAVHNKSLQAWVDAYHPQHLGGQSLRPVDPFDADAQVEQAMVHLTRHLSRGKWTDPAEIDVVTKTLHQLRAQGCRYTPDQLLAAALQLGWPGHRAFTLHETAAQLLTSPTAPRPIGFPPLQPSS